ncbi:MAG: hypothetical protein RL559_759 [Pseudomonadota bacterium]|jgi:uncharacterized protein
MDKTLDPRHLDIRAFALAGAELQGQSPLGQWPRLREEQVAGAPATEPVVRWHLRGQAQPVAGGAPRLGMALRAELDLPLQCQRCLTPVVKNVAAHRDFVFVADEATAEALDEASEEDVLVISRDFDALALVEDELILALPLVPRHEVCPQQLPTEALDDAFEAASERPKPFAALAALKKGG